MTEPHDPHATPPAGLARPPVQATNTELQRAEPGMPGPVPATPWLERVRTDHRLPEIVTTAQPSIADVLEDARRPEPGAQEPARWRIAWAYGVTVPVKAAATFVGWLAEHPGRLVPAIGLALLLGTAISQSGIPVLSWLTPSVMDITTWF